MHYQESKCANIHHVITPPKPIKHSSAKMRSYLKRTLRTRRSVVVDPTLDSYCTKCWASRGKQKWIACSSRVSMVPLEPCFKIVSKFLSALNCHSIGQIQSHKKNARNNAKLMTQLGNAGSPDIAAVVRCGNSNVPRVNFC